MLRRIAITPHNIEWGGAEIAASQEITQGWHIVQSWDHGKTHFVDAATAPSRMPRHRLLSFELFATGETADDLNAAVRSQWSNE